MQLLLHSFILLEAYDSSVLALKPSFILIIILAMVFRFTIPPMLWCLSEQPATVLRNLPFSSSLYQLLSAVPAFDSTDFLT